MNTQTLSPCECRFRGIGLLVIAWLLAVVAAGASGVLASTDGLLRLAMPAMILLPVAGFAVAWRGSAEFRARVLDINTGMLVILHSWRMVGAGFLFLYAHDLLPGLFAWLAGTGDMIAAIGAVFIGSALLQGHRVSRTTLLGWNTLGLLDCIVAVLVGTALRSHYLGGNVNTDMMVQLPLSLVPTVVVPLYVITHIVIYLQMRYRTV